MKTMILALAAVATLGIAAPAFAQNSAPRGTAVNKVSSQDFSSRHRYWHRHHRHRHCTTFWRHGRRVTVCR